MVLFIFEHSDLSEFFQYSHKLFSELKVNIILQRTPKALHEQITLIFIWIPNSVTGI